MSCSSHVIALSCRNNRKISVHSCAGEKAQEEGDVVISLTTSELRCTKGEIQNQFEFKKLDRCTEGNKVAMRRLAREKEDLVLKKSVRQRE